METAGFIDLAVRSGLRSADELRDAYSAFQCDEPMQYENGFAELIDFCNWLVQNEVLTGWQCDMLLNGRYKGFFLDQFRLLRRVGFAGQCTLYDAEDGNTKRQVVLRVVPLCTKRHADGTPYYDVAGGDAVE
jgi:hypothetical protein